MKALIAQIEGYIPDNEQEEKDKETLLKLLTNQEDIWHRTNLIGHMTASAWVLNPSRTKILMAHHNLYNAWSWLGGHADGASDLLAVAIREVQEESGIQSVKAISTDIFSLEILTVDGHEKNGQYIPSHLHLNITYLLEADDREDVQIKADENSAVGWFTPDEAVAKSVEPWFQERIYKKLNAKLINILGYSTEAT